MRRWQLLYWMGRQVKRGKEEKKTAALFEGLTPQFGAMVVPAGTSRHRGGAIHAIVGGAGIRWE